MVLPLKEIPLENGNREPLAVCGKCFGSGVCRTSVSDYALTSGATFLAGQALTPDQVSTFGRKKWKYHSAECASCGGAGLVKARA